MKRALAVAVGVAVALVCIRLGLWQLDRLRQRHAYNVTVETRRAAPTVVVNSLTDGSGDSAAMLVYRRAVARGVFDFERQLVVMGRSYRGLPAVAIVTPLRLSPQVAVLIERGLALSPDARSVSLPPLDETDSSVAAGVLLPAERARPTLSAGWPLRVREVDPAAVATRYPYRLLPVVLRRDSVANGPAGLYALPIPALTNGPHLSYAIQWFAFAAIALVGSALLSRRMREAGREGPDT